eukprot:2965545-Amphidinium_carterae.2
MPVASHKHVAEELLLRPFMDEVRVWSRWSSLTHIRASISNQEAQSSTLLKSPYVAQTDDIAHCVEVL